MRRLALCFALVNVAACTTEPDRPWVVQDAVASGDMQEADAAAAPDASNGSVAEQAPLLDSEPVPIVAELPDADANNAGEVASIGFEQSELPSQESDALAADDGVMTDGVMADGVMADGVMADGVMADGVMADGVMADGTMSDALPQQFDEPMEVPVASLSPRPSETLVRIESSTGTAEVWTDGILLGPANEFLTLDPGKHELEIRASGFAPVYRQITLTPRAKQTIKVNLAPLAH